MLRAKTQGTAGARRHATPRSRARRGGGGESVRERGRRRAQLGAARERAEHLAARGAETQAPLPGGGPRPLDLAKQQGHRELTAFLSSRELVAAEIHKQGPREVAALLRSPRGQERGGSSRKRKRRGRRDDIGAEL